VKSVLELQNIPRAKDELARAFMGGGDEIFADDDPKYWRFIREIHRPAASEVEDAGIEGFVENLPKRRVLRPAGQLRVTGLVTNSGLSVPRAARRRFRAILHACSRIGVTREATGHEEPRAFLMGFASYVAMVQPDAGAKVRSKVKRLLTR
jgi:hypothetical protein